MVTTRHARAAFLGIYLVTFAICSISPYSRGVWWAENIPILAVVGLVLVGSHWHDFSPTAYGMMLVLVVLHTIGGHYTFERVPFDWVTHALGAQRNHYDRIAHFSVGFYAYAIAEIIYRHRLVNARFLLVAFPILTIFTLAAVYELFEWIYAVSADPSAGIAVLGSQGDVWDAQKDMLSDGLGAILATLVFALRFGGAQSPREGEPATTTMSRNANK